MKKIFVTTVYRSKAHDFYGFAMSEDGELLAEEIAEDHTWIKLQLGLDDSITNHQTYKEKYPEGFNLVFVDQYEFDDLKEFREARQKSLHIYAGSTI